MADIKTRLANQIIAELKAKIKPRFEQLESDNVRLQTENNTLQTENNALQLTNQALQTETRRLQSTNTDKDNEITRLRDIIASLETLPSVIQNITEDEFFNFDS
jgi:predicted nuclease with TOPRIM domain